MVLSVFFLPQTMVNVKLELMHFKCLFEVINQYTIVVYGQTLLVSDVLATLLAGTL